MTLCTASFSDLESPATVSAQADSWFQPSLPGGEPVSSFQAVLLF